MRQCGFRMSQCGAQISQDAPKSAPRRQAAPRCAKVAPKWANMRQCGSRAGGSSPKAPKGGLRRTCVGVVDVDDWSYGKTTLWLENEAPVYTGCCFDDPAETHPAEGMTKVIPALSCKHDNEERRSGSDDFLARRQLLRQRGGFIRSAHSASPSLETWRLGG